MPRSAEKQADAGIERLADFLRYQATTLGIYFGWATGNNASVVLEHMQRYPDFPWKFLLSGLGTELYWNHHDLTQREDTCWPTSTPDQFQACITSLTAELSDVGIELSLQAEVFQQKRIRGYYLKADTGTDQEDIQKLKAVAQKNRIKAEITRANPAAGDPEGVYDVAFLPVECGKLEGLKHIASHLSIPPSNIISFGDSCNDLSMLEYSTHAYLVENADPHAKALFPKVIEGHYCNGILNGLQKHLSPCP